jgi:hypothetical protein
VGGPAARAGGSRQLCRTSKTPPGQPAQPATIAGSHRDCQHLAGGSQQPVKPTGAAAATAVASSSFRPPRPARAATGAMSRRVPSQCRHRPGMTGARRRPAGPRPPPTARQAGAAALTRTGTRTRGARWRESPEAHNLKRKQGGEAAPKESRTLTRKARRLRRATACPADQVTETGRGARCHGGLGGSLSRLRAPGAAGPADSSH